MQEPGKDKGEEEAKDGDEAAAEQKLNEETKRREEATNQLTEHQREEALYAFSCPIPTYYFIVNHGYSSKPLWPCPVNNSVSGSGGRRNRSQLRGRKERRRGRRPKQPPAKMLQLTRRWHPARSLKCRRPPPSKVFEPRLRGSQVQACNHTSRSLQPASCAPCASSCCAASSCSWTSRTSTISVSPCGSPVRELQREHSSLPPPQSSRLLRVHKVPRHIRQVLLGVRRQAPLLRPLP
jgi:hypothetical protein